MRSLTPELVFVKRCSAPNTTCYCLEMLLYLMQKSQVPYSVSKTPSNCYKDLINTITDCGNCSEKDASSVTPRGTFMQRWKALDSFACARYAYSNPKIYEENNFHLHIADYKLSAPMESSPEIMWVLWNNNSFAGSVLKYNFFLRSVAWIMTAIIAMTAKTVTPLKQVIEMFFFCFPSCFRKNNQSKTTASAFVKDCKTVRPT